jgi:hypothetical protein
MAAAGMVEGWIPAFAGMTGEMLGWDWLAAVPWAIYL